MGAVRTHVDCYTYADLVNVCTVMPWHSVQSPPPTTTTTHMRQHRSLPAAMRHIDIAARENCYNHHAGAGVATIVSTCCA